MWWIGARFGGQRVVRCPPNLARATAGCGLRRRGDAPAGLHPEVDEREVIIGNLRNCLRLRQLAGSVGPDWLGEDRPADREAEDARHGGGDADPVADLVHALAAAEDD